MLDRLEDVHGDVGHLDLGVFDADDRGSRNLQFAAIVGGLAVPITLRVVNGVVARIIATASVSPRARPNPSITPETIPERA